MVRLALACLTFLAALGAWVLVARALRADGWRAVDEAARAERDAED